MTSPPGQDKKGEDYLGPDQNFVPVLKCVLHLWQVDLQSIEKEKGRISAELQRLQSLAHSIDDVKRENRELCRRLSEQGAPQTCPDDDLRVKKEAEILLITNKDMTFLYAVHQHSLTLGAPLQVQCQTLACKLQDVQEKLAAEREETKNAKIRAEYLERELQQTRGQLESVISSYEQEQRKSSKQEVNSNI